jgi:SAM-dependent methyltransferase
VSGTHRAVAAAAAALVAAGWWWRKHPSACPYGQRFWVEAPHPFITRERLRRVLEPRPAERVLEIGPGTGYYTLDLAEWVGPDGRVEIFDLQQEMLDHTLRRAAERGLANIGAAQGDAQQLPFEDGSFDGVVLVATLGEVPDQDAAMREVARVLRPAGRLVTGELAGDPHFVTPGSLRRRAEAAGLGVERRDGPPFGYFARLRKAG